MSEKGTVAYELNRISTQKNIIRDKLRDMGLVGAQESPNIDGLASTMTEKIRIDTGATSREVLEGESLTIQAGYYKSDVTVSGKTNETADKAKIKTFDNPITPTKSDQPFIVPEGFYGFGSFTVKAIGNNYTDTSDANVVDADVLAGKIFYNKDGRDVGTMPNNGAVTKTIGTTSPVSSDGEYYYANIDQGYHNGSGIVRVKKVARADMVMSVFVDEADNQIAIAATNDQQIGLTSGIKSKTEYVELIKEGKKVTAKVVGRDVEISEEVDDGVVSVTGGSLIPGEGNVSATGNGVQLSEALSSPPTALDSKYITVVGYGSVSRNAVLLNQTAGYITEETDKEVISGGSVDSLYRTMYYELPKEFIDTTLDENYLEARYFPKGMFAFVNGAKLEGSAELYGVFDVFKLGVGDEDLEEENVVGTLSESPIFIIPEGFHAGDSVFDFSVIVKELEKI